MKAHSSFKIFVDNQAIDVNTTKQNERLPQWQRSILAFVQDFLSHRDLVKVKTSGSTGVPKQIALLKARMINSAKMTGAFLGLKEKDSALLCLSADYIAGKMMLVRAMVLGLEIHCYEPKSKMLEHLNQHFTFSAMVPMQAMANLNWLSKIDKLIIGGGSISKIDQLELLQTKHSGLYQTFGMTETISHVALKLISDEYYKALSGISFSLSKKQTLVIDAPKVLDTPITTNDLVELKSKHSFKWLGRIDNVINSGGVKIIPEKVEREIEKIISAPFFVFGIPDARLGEKLVLFVEDLHDSTNRDKLKNLDLISFEIPKEVIRVAQFVRTDTGKIQRKKTVKVFLDNS